VRPGALSQDQPLPSLSSPLSPPLLRVIRQLWLRVNWAISTDLLPDCELEVALFLETHRPRIEALPEEAREAYRLTCARRIVWRLLQRELRQKARAVSLERLVLEDGSRVEPAAEATADWVELAGDHLLDHLSQPDLATAFCSLSSGDQEILDLFYGKQLSDREIAGRLRLAPPAVKMRRPRSLHTLARLLDGG